MWKTAEPAADKSTGGLSASDAQDILADEEIRQHWLLFAYATLERLGIQHPTGELVKQSLTREAERRGKRFALAEGEEEMIFAVTLGDAIKTKRPDIYHVIGNNLVHLQQWTFAVLGATAPDEATKEALLKAAREASPQSVQIEHFPDNPITVVQHPLTG